MIIFILYFCELQFACVVKNSEKGRCTRRYPTRFASFAYYLTQLPSFNFFFLLLLFLVMELANDPLIDAKNPMLAKETKSGLILTFLFFLFFWGG